MKRSPLSALLLAVFAFGGTCVTPALAQRGAAAADDPIKTLVERLDLEKYKATIKGLTQFGDRRQGTARNRAAVDWIEAQLRSYGCATARLTYHFQPPPPRPPRPPVDSATRAREQMFNAGGARSRGVRAPTGVNTDSARQPDP